MIISRYHLPTRGTPEVVQITAADLHALLHEASQALKRVRPQVRGALCEQDVDAALKALQSALEELQGIAGEAPP